MPRQEDSVSGVFRADPFVCLCVWLRQWRFVSSVGCQRVEAAERRRGRRWTVRWFRGCGVEKRDEDGTEGRTNHVTKSTDGKEKWVVLLQFELSEESQEDASERFMVVSGIVKCLL